MASALREQQVRNAVDALTERLDTQQTDIRVAVLRGLGVLLSPPEEIPVVLDTASAATIVAALQAVPPEIPGTGVGVPLAATLMRYEHPLPRKVGVVATFFTAKPTGFRAPASMLPSTKGVSRTSLPTPAIGSSCRSARRRSIASSQPEFCTRWRLREVQRPAVREAGQLPSTARLQMQQAVARWALARCLHVISVVRQLPIP